MKETVDFLYNIYSQQCEKGDYLFLSIKSPNITWKDIPIRYDVNTIKNELSNVLGEYPPEQYDLYWSPMAYSQNKRRLDGAQDTKFLAQDIDENDNPNNLNPAPSYIWESSPNKFQGLWELDRYISHEEYTPLNKALAKHIGCDDCFDFPHVYRIPGTINHKYKNLPPVSIAKATNKIYKPKTIKRLVGQPKEVLKTEKEPTNITLTERKIYAKYSIPKKVRDLLALDDLVGIDRSNTIWYIENKLHELGMSPNEIINLVKNSVFNKYKGRHDEDKRLRSELDKIISGEVGGDSDLGEGKGLNVSSYQEVMGNPKTFEGWLVKGFWARRSHGIVAGMPKCFKSTLVHDLVVSVASGKPFLGKYPVLEPGPVIVVQNENADYMIKDRTEKLILHRGLEGKVETNKNKVKLQFPPNLPIHFINQQGFCINNKEHRSSLEKLIKETKPVLVVLDPLYLMFEGDLNSAKELNPALNWLLFLKNEYRTSIMLIHHYNKGTTGASKGGSRMMGSIILYGWVESAWYLSKEELEENIMGTPDSMSQEPSVVTLNREFRTSGHYPELDIHIKLGEVGKPEYEVDVTLSGGSSTLNGNMGESIINLLSSSSIPLSRTNIAESLGLELGTTKRLLDTLLLAKRIIPNAEGFTVYKNYSN